MGKYTGGGGGGGGTWDEARVFIPLVVHYRFPTDL